MAPAQLRLQPFRVHGRLLQALAQLRASVEAAQAAPPFHHGRGLRRERASEALEAAHRLAQEQQHLQALASGAELAVAQVLRRQQQTCLHRLRRVQRTAARRLCCCLERQR